MKKIPVPLFKQHALTCGVTALRMVLSYFGREVTSRKIIEKIGGIKKYGVKTIKLADFAKDLGFKVECYSYNQKLSQGKASIRKPSKWDIINFLKKRLPVIIVVRSFILFNKKPSNQGHFMVMTKYNKGVFWYNDPKDGKQHRLQEEDLMFAWFNNVLDSSAYLLVLQPKNKI